MKPLERLPTGVFLLLTLVGLEAAPPAAERIQVITNSLVCTCGCASLIVATCDCGQAAEMRREAAALVEAGKSDQDIYQTFERKYGPRVLGAPKIEGFNALAWLLPFVGLALGGAAVLIVIKRLKTPVQEAETGFSESPGIDEKHRRLLEEELEG